MGYKRVQAILDNDRYLDGKQGPKDHCVETRTGEKVYYSDGTAKVTEALHTNGNDAHKVSKDTVMAMALRVLRLGQSEPSHASDSKSTSTGSSLPAGLGQEQIVEIDIDEIDLGAETETRELDDEVLEDYMAIWKSGEADFPPVDLFHEQTGAKYLPGDGRHRIVSAKQAGRKTIRARIRRGTALDAFVAAGGCNATHGYRRTEEAKRYMVDKALVRLKEWSDRSIAERFKVSPTFVGERRKLLKKGTVHVDSCDERRVGRDGKKRRLPRSERSKPKGKGAHRPSGSSNSESQDAHSDGDPSVAMARERTRDFQRAIDQLFSGANDSSLAQLKVILAEHGQWVVSKVGVADRWRIVLKPSQK